MSKGKGFQEGKNPSFPLEPNKESTDWGKITCQEDSYFIFYFSPNITPKAAKKEQTDEILGP